jgi:hypothetical protein
MATREVEAMYCLVICQYKGGIKEVRNGYKVGGGHILFGHSSPPLY